MKRIFSTPDRALAGMAQALLESNRIRTWLKNEFIAGGIGDIPAQECWQEIWILDDRDEGPALRLLESLAPQAGVNRAPWQCHACGEWLDAAFTDCWHCADTSISSTSRVQTELNPSSLRKQGPS